MSGGTFDYDQYKIDQIAETIQSYIYKNGKEDWMNYSVQTMREFQNAVIFLTTAAVYAQRIDWLLAGDDDEATFHERLREDLTKLKHER